MHVRWAHPSRARQKQEFESTTNQLLTVTLARPKKDTLTMTVVVDSISQVTPMGSTPGIERLVGLKADAKLSPAGMFYSAQGPKDTIAVAENMAESLGRFLPRIRSRLSTGSRWIDTTRGSVKQGGIDVVLAEGEEQSNLKLVFSANGMEINVVQTANTKVERVKK